MSLRIDSITCCWVTLSSALVASSRKMIRGRETSARAIAIRCRWPPESVPAPSLSTVNMPIGISAMSASMPTISIASQASSAV